jgi:methylmalonyl-CoA mutase N-terminal domain/subunit
MATLTIDAEIERQQIERVRAVRSGRSESEWRAALARVSSAARDGSNLVPAIVAAVEARATVGEISDGMRTVFGEYKETSSL